MLVPVSAIYACISALLIIYVAYRVIGFSKGVKLSSGYRAEIAGDTPIMLLLLMLAELNSGSTLLVHGMGMLLLGSQMARSMVFLRLLGRYVADNAYCVVLNRCVLLLLVLVNMVLAIR